MNNDNLKLWEQVDKTDPTNTKSAKKGAYTFTSITPMSQFKQATKVFGIQGLKWGVVIGSEKYIEQTIGTTVLLNYDAVMYFILDGERGEIPIHATEKLAYQTQGANGYLKIDDEVRKKVVTNAKTKGLSELGFNADIFMKQFDDPNYVQEATNAANLEKAEDKIAEQEKQDREHMEWKERELKAYTLIPNVEALKSVYTAHIRKLKLKGDDQAIRIFTKFKDDRKAELEKDA